MPMIRPTDFARALSGYFFEYLPVQKGLSENTIQSYHDSMSVFLSYCESERHLKREKMEIKDLDRKLVEDFLDWLEQEKGNSAATRNQRRIALNTFFKYLQYENPEHVLLCQTVCSIPKKKHEKQTIRHLPVDAIKAILKQPDQQSHSGRRDFSLLCLMYEAGARISEIADLRIGDLSLDKKGAIVHLHGKGKKARSVPLIADISAVLRLYLQDEKRYRPCLKDEPLFCNRHKEKLTRAGISYIFHKYAESARIAEPELFPEKVYPHIFRHSRAMHWLEAGIDLQYIKDLLGHADLTTTEVYAQINTEMKRKVLESAQPQERPAAEYPSWTEDKSLSGYFAAGGTPRQGPAAYAQSGAGTAGAGDVTPAISMCIRRGCEGGGKGPLLQIEKSGTLATGNDQYLFAPKDAVEILNDQGGDSLCVEKGGVSPTLRSQTHGNLPITAYAIQGSMIGGEDSPHAVTNSGCTAQFPPDAMVGINGNLAGTLLASYYKGTGMRCGRERDVVLCASSGQSHAEILRELSPTLNCASEQPYVVRPGDTGQGNELDFCVMSAGFKHKAGSQSGSIGFQEETAPTLLAGQQSAVMKACLIGGAAVMEAQTAAVDCRNLRETDEVSGTLLAKAASGGYSLNYQNPVRTGLCVRRLTPTEAERLQGYPDGWTEAGADGSPISDTKRYQMLGNSIAVPCVAYIMQGITDAVNQACEKGGKKL